MAIQDHEEKHHEEKRTVLSPRESVATSKAGPSVQGYNGKEHDDVLRRVNRKPLTADGKPTVTNEGNVITVNMPNHAIYRVTLGERAVPKEVPVQAQKELPKGAVVPETITADDVKTWEYTAPPVVAAEKR